MRFLSIILALCFFNATATLAQNGAIQLNNPSFEDMPRHSKAPRGWHDCGFPGESAPDVQPNGTFMTVDKPAIDGNTYLGMVVRDNDTWEKVGQRLSQPMQGGQCYEFSIHLSRSELYISQSRLNNEEVNYITPTKLRIYGGFGYCDKQELLAETILIKNTRWIEFRFKLEPSANYTYILFEAFYKTPTLFPYNGNILLDKASALEPIPCEEPLAEKEPEQEVAPPATPETPEPPATPKTPEVEPQSTPEPTPEVVTIPEPLEETPVAPTLEPSTTEEEEITIAGLKKSDLKKGQTIRIENLYFRATKAIITDESFPILEQVFQFLNAHQDVAVEIGGHTNNLPSHDICDRLSKERAKAVVDYLMGKGISRERLAFKGYGKRKPIADNKTLAGRRKNQRVEIKILEVNNNG
jgi:outer membrane protein OmpA-like peptidoglycan-associated protein